MVNFDLTFFSLNCSGRTGCRYNMRERFTAECNTATQMVTISLKKGGAECDQTKQVACPRKSSKGTNRGK